MRRSIPLMILISVGVVFSQTQTEKKVYTAKPINPIPPMIDGKLNELVWHKVDWQGDVTQRRPNDGAEPSQKTAFKVLFDDKNIYVAIRAYDTERFQTFTGTEIQFDSDLNEHHIDEDADGVVDYTVGNPDFNFRQFRSNLVMRWEYNPGSTLFLVWTQERTGVAGNGRFSFRNDLSDLFNEDATNVFLVKFSRWFSL